MEEKKNPAAELTAERSLEIIRESIEQSRRTITKNSYISIIWWGSVTAAFAVLIYYLWKNMGGPAWNVLWAVMWAVGYVGQRLIDKKKEHTPPNFVGKTIGHVWATFGIFCGAVGWTYALVGFGVLPLHWIMPNPHYLINLTGLIAFNCGVGGTITGFILKNRAIQICGFLAGVGGLFVAQHFSGAEQLLVMAGVAVIGLIVPGVIIKLANTQ